MIQEDMVNISFIAAHIEAPLLYGAGCDQNLLFCWNMETKEIENLGAFRGFGGFKGDNIGAVYRYGEQLFCFSKYSYEVAAWHLKEKTFTYYHPECWMEETVCIRSICRVGDDVWMMRKATDSSIAVFSMRNGKFASHTVTTDLEQHFQISEITSYVYENSVTAGDWIWRCIPGTAALLGFDTKSLETEIVKFDIPDTFYTISGKDGWFHILGVCGKYVVAWNPNTREQMVWETGYEGISDRPFREVVRAGNRLFLLPCFEEKIFCYEIQENHICFIGKPEYPAEFARIHDPENRTLFLGNAFIDKELLYLFPIAGNGLLSLHTQSMQMSFFPMQVSKNEYIKSQTDAGNTIPEYRIKLQDYLGSIRSSESDDEQDDRDMFDTGKTCWRELCK